MKSIYSFETMKPYFDELVRTTEVYIKTEAINLAKKIIIDKEAYHQVEIATRVPWYLIASLHNKESSRSFLKNLCNGQKLNMVTTIVPKGRGPYSSWYESAVDALGLEKNLIDSLDLTQGWSLAECLWFAMRYNGTGYNARGLNSPYVFAGTTAYKKGGFPRDHVFDPEFVVTNLGAFAILWAIREVQGFLDEREMHVKITKQDDIEMPSMPEPLDI